MYILTKSVEELLLLLLLLLSKSKVGISQKLIEEGLSCGCGDLWQNCSCSCNRGNRGFNRCFDRCFNRRVDRCFDRSVDRCFDRCFGRSVDRCFDRCESRFVSRCGLSVLNLAGLWLPGTLFSLRIFFGFR